MENPSLLPSPAQKRRQRTPAIDDAAYRCACAARAARDFNEGICEVVIAIRYVLREFNRLAVGTPLAPVAWQRHLTLLD